MPLARRRSVRRRRRRTGRGLPAGPCVAKIEKRRALRSRLLLLSLDVEYQRRAACRGEELLNRNRPQVAERFAGAGDDVALEEGARTHVLLLRSFKHELV